MEDQAASKAVTGAAIALLVWSGGTAVALASWFSVAGLTWKSFVAGVCSLFGVIASFLLWKSPSRASAVVGILVMLGSLARIGVPAEWTWVSFALVAVTFVLLMPLVHAAMTLRG